MSFQQQLDDDIENVFLNPNDFGVVATYNPKSDAPYLIRCIFTESHKDIDLGGEVMVSSTHPHCVVRATDIVGGPHVGDGITINSINYNIYDQQPDGYGIVDLELHVINA